MGAIYTVETRITIPVGDSGAGYCVGRSSNGVGPFRAPSSGIIHSLGVTLRDPSVTLPGAGTYAVAVYAIPLTAGGQAEVDRAAFQVLRQVPITPGAAGPAYGAAGMFFQGSMPTTGIYKVRSPDVFLTNGGAGYKFSCGRVTAPALGALSVAIETDGNIVGAPVEWIVTMGIEGLDSAAGDPQVFYRNADPGSF